MIIEFKINENSIKIFLILGDLKLKLNNTPDTITGINSGNKNNFAFMDFWKPLLKF